MEYTDFKDFMQSHEVIWKLNTMCKMHGIPCIAVSGGFGKAGTTVKAYIILEYRQADKTLGMIKVMLDREVITGDAPYSNTLDLRGNINSLKFSDTERMILRICRLLYEVFQKYTPAIIKYHFEKLAETNKSLEIPDPYLRIVVDYRGRTYFTN